MKSRLILSAVLLVGCGIGVAAAQSPAGQVSGRAVSARDEQPLALVQIELSGTSFTAVTADDGTFKIEHVPAGTYVLQATSVGYRGVRENFALAEGETK